MHVVLRDFDKGLEVVAQIELVVAVQVTREIAGFDTAVGRQGYLVVILVAGQQLDVTKQIFREAAVRKLTRDGRTGPQNDLESELTGEFQEYDQMKS